MFSALCSRLAMLWFRGVEEELSSAANAPRAVLADTVSGMGLCWASAPRRLCFSLFSRQLLTKAGPAQGIGVGVQAWQSPRKSAHERMCLTCLQAMRSAEVLRKGSLKGRTCFCQRKLACRGKASGTARSHGLRRRLRPEIRCA